MTKEESKNIKDEILKKEGTLHMDNMAIIIDGVIETKDVFDIIDKHTEKERQK